MVNQEKEIFEQVFKGHPETMQFCLDVLYIAHLWDDLIDKDKTRLPEEINQAFEILLLGMPSNPFYRTYQAALMPLIHIAISSWYEANRRQHGIEQDKFYAFYLRNQLLNIVYFSCLMVNGDIAILHDHFSRQMKLQYDTFLKE